MEKDMFKKSGGVLARAVLATLMALLVHISVIFCGNFLLTNAEGYDVYVLNEETNKQELYYTHYFADSAEDTKLAELDEAKTPYLKQEIRSQLNSVEKGVLAVISQLFCLGIIISFIYVYMWKIGNSDLNLVKFNRIKFDKFNGLKIGCLADIPFVLVYLMLVMGTVGILPGKVIIFYRAVYGFVFPLTSQIIGSSFLADELSVLKLLLLSLMVFIIPLICHFSYLIGYKDISIKNKIVYKEG